MPGYRHKLSLLSEVQAGEILWCWCTEALLLIKTEPCQNNSNWGIVTEMDVASPQSAAFPLGLTEKQTRRNISGSNTHDSNRWTASFYSLWWKSPIYTVQFSQIPYQLKSVKMTKRSAKIWLASLFSFLCLLNHSNMICAHPELIRANAETVKSLLLIVMLHAWLSNINTDTWLVLDNTRPAPITGNSGFRKGQRIKEKRSDITFMTASIFTFAS